MAGYFRSFSFLGGRTLFLNNRLNQKAFEPQVMGLRKETKEKIEQLNLPEKPKKPPTAYLQFVNEHRQVVKNENPDWKPTEVVKKCAELWQNCSSSVREQYMNNYVEKVKKYNEDLLKYSASLSVEQQSFLKQIEEEKKNIKTKRLQKQFCKETNKPKRPPTAYSIFLAEKSKMTNKPISVLMSELKNEWARLSEKEKEKYHIQHVKEKERYDKEMELWEARMLNEGREDLVRLKTLEEKRPQIQKDSKFDRKSHLSE